jgi:BirA family biotin operon repressor/biotin-[acetyl-CoA-carboxylase] ligase
MEWEIVHIDETDSTNQWMKHHLSDTDFCVVADYQTAGRGCGSNTWESERGQNLLFSVLLHPLSVPASKQFHISMAVSVAISEALEQYSGDVSIKWPNDIYWRNGKICGILIEQTLKGTAIRECIVGVGLNVNQRAFHSGAPNPVSLWQISGQPTDRMLLLSDILQRLQRLMAEDVRQRYLQRLYRRRGFHPYTDARGAFMAEIASVEDDGHLLLRDDSGRERRYAFKEVQFVM